MDWRKEVDPENFLKLEARNFVGHLIPFPGVNVGSEMCKERFGSSCSFRLKKCLDGMAIRRTSA